MTLHPVPFSVGVSLGLSLGTVPESELINPSLKTQTLLRKASQQMHVHPISSDFLRVQSLSECDGVTAVQLRSSRGPAIFQGAIKYLVGK